MAMGVLLAVCPTYLYALVMCLCVQQPVELAWKLFCPALMCSLAVSLHAGGACNTACGPTATCLPR